MVEDTLIEHAHTKPLLPSQLVRYREVQLPDSKLNGYFKFFRCTLNQGSWSANGTLR